MIEEITRENECISTDSEDKPLIKYTTNKRLLRKNRQRVAILKKHIIKKSKRRALKTLYNLARKLNRTSKRKLRNYKLRPKRRLSFTRNDDSTDYSANYIPSASSSSTEIYNVKSCRKGTKTKYRNVGWKRKGRKINERTKKYRKIVNVHDSGCHKSGPWTLRDSKREKNVIRSPNDAAEPLKTVKQKSRRLAILKESAKIS